MLNKVKTQLLALVGVVSLSSQSFAVTVLSGTETAQIADAQADIITIGSAIIAVAAVVLAIRWVKAIFF